MKITIDVTKSLEKNAADYFEKAKKSKHKMEGAKEALQESKKKLAKLEKQIMKKEELEKKKNHPEKNNGLKSLDGSTQVKISL